MPILKEESFEPRDYQRTIAEKAAKQSTLVVLPTGMGKTLIAVMVGAWRLDELGGKILITAPTRPLNAQHTHSFEQFTHIPMEDIVLITGNTKPESRKKIYGKATIVAATPQCIENDLAAGRLNLSDFTLVIFDEAHRGVKNYSYTTIAKKYMMQAKNPLILGLTASPGSSRARIEEVASNLYIKAVEVRSEQDEDVKPYVQQTQQDWVYVDFPAEHRKIKALLEEVLKDDVWWLKEKHYIHTYKPGRKMLLAVQQRVAASYKRDRSNYGSLWAIIRSAEAIKLEHAIEMLETQGIGFLYDYLRRVAESKKRTDARMMKNKHVIEAMKLVDDLQAASPRHPKMEKLREIVKHLAKPGVKIIVFANYRATVEKIRETLEKEGVSARAFIGQQDKEGKGMRQDEQLATLDDFRRGEFNVLVSTSVGEEGLDVPAVDYAIFYEPVPSEIRQIQRRGRVGRQSAGKTIFLITKGTRDEAYYWAALNKEKRMKGVLQDMQAGRPLRRKKSLLDWAEKN
ncbi:MAG: helicase-related protein [Candidatus Aenigmatarchaeota archaeon]